jgi:hypothetical protein
VGGPQVFFHLGAAIGRLVRLRSLYLNISKDGRDYHTLGRGMATGGCPELWELQIESVAKNAEYLALAPSVIVPSIRVMKVSTVGGGLWRRGPLAGVV